MGGGVVIVNSTGACTLNGTSSIVANGVAGTTTSGGAGGSINLKCASFALNSTNATAVISANGGSGAGGGASAVAGGGGGRIALISSANTGTSAFSGLSYPNSAATLTSFIGKIKAIGGEGNATNGAYANGGAGTIYLKHSGSVHGDLLINNNSIVLRTNGGITRMPSTTANTNVLFSSSGTTATLTSAATPLASYVNWYKDFFVHTWQTSGGSTYTDPMNTTNRTEVVLSANAANTFTGATSFPTSSGSTYSYRIVYKVDRIQLTGTAQVNFNGADLIIAGPPSGTGACDLTGTTNKALTVPSGSALTMNAIASNHCSSAGLSGTINGTLNWLEP